MSLSQFSEKDKKILCPKFKEVDIGGFQGFPDMISSLLTVLNTEWDTGHNFIGFCFTVAAPPYPWNHVKHQISQCMHYSQHVILEIKQQRFILKKEFIVPGLHLRPVHADHAWPPFHWTLNSVFSAYENNNRRIRPPPDRGTLKIVSRLLIA